jgi:hypothetical protein
MLGCPGVHGHLLANQTLYLKHHCADRRHQGCQYGGPGTSVRRRFSGSSRTSRCLPVFVYLGCRNVSTMADRDINATRKRFLLCWRRRSRSTPEDAAGPFVILDRRIRRLSKGNRWIATPRVDQPEPALRRTYAMPAPQLLRAAG